MPCHYSRVTASELPAPTQENNNNSRNGDTLCSTPHTYRDGPTTETLSLSHTTEVLDVGNISNVLYIVHPSTGMILLGLCSKPGTLLTLQSLSANIWDEIFSMFVPWTGVTSRTRVVCAGGKGAEMLWQCNTCDDCVCSLIRNIIVGLRGVTRQGRSHSQQSEILSVWRDW